MVRRPDMDVIAQTLGEVHTRGLGAADEPELSALAVEPESEPERPPQPQRKPERPTVRPAAPPPGGGEELLWTKLALPHESAYAARAIASRGERRKDLTLSQEIVLGALVRAALALLGPLDVRGLSKYDQDELTARIVAELRGEEARAAA